MRERPEKDQRRAGQQPSSTGGFKLQIDERDLATGNIDLPQRRRSQPTPYAPTANDQGYLTEKERKAEKKAHKKRDKLKARKNKRVFSLVWICMVVLVSLTLASYLVQGSNDFLAVGRAEGTTTVNIPEGGLTDVDQLAQILYDSGAINKPEFFSLYCKITMDEEELSWISSGAYELETNKDYEDLINTLQGGNEVKEEVTVTIPEGYNALEIAAVLEENEVCDAQEFLDYLNTGDFTNYEEVAQIGDTSGRYYALEGYLFPDTYTFYKNDDLDMVIGKMLNNFHEKMTEDILNSVAQSDYTLDEIITLASIIQNEAADSNDMYKVSAVLHNRLEWGGQQDIYVLGCDSTVYYPYRNAAAVPTSDALSYGNYNTYDIQGLPPGPISNPGIDAIMAALRPSTDGSAPYYLYFCHAADGTAYYATNQWDHEYNLQLAGLTD